MKITTCFCSGNSIEDYDRAEVVKTRGKDFSDKTGFQNQMYIDSIIKVFYSPTDAQANCLENAFKIYFKIDIKTAPTCFGAVTIIRGCSHTTELTTPMYFN
jgi:hypothetical protein